MAEPSCGDAIGQIKSNYYQADWQEYYAMEDENLGEADLNPFKDHYACLVHIFDELDHIRAAIRYLTAYWTPYSTYGGVLAYYLDYCTGGNDLTMSSILLAMLTATQPELMSFVGITDAYRQSIWNQPFNQEYYAALARGFTKWE